MNSVKIILFLFLAALTSCTYNATDDGVALDTGTNPNQNLVLTVDKSQVYDNTTVNFTVMDASGVDVTAQVVISVDGTPISGSSTILSGLGIKDAVAALGTDNSNTVQVAVIEPSFTTKALIEDYTGTWCGYCPRVTTAITNVKSQNNNAIAIAVHNDNAMGYQYVDQMENTFNVSGYPTGRLNRTGDWNESVGQVNALTSLTQPVGLAINTSLSNNMMDVTVKVGFDLNMNNMKLVVCVVEDGVIHNQANFYDTDASSPWYQQGNPIVGFVHDDVMRSALTDIFGDDIPAADSEAGDEYVQTFNVQVPSNVGNTANTKIVAFVVDSSDEVINVQEVHLGSNQDFD